MKPYMTLLRNHAPFRRLWAGEVISGLGDWMSYVAISLLALGEGGGAGALALAGVLVAHHLPHTLLSPVSGTLADRFDRRQLLVGINVLQALLVGLMVLAAHSGQVFVLQALVFVRSGLAAIELPARSAALRRLVPAEQRLTANALSASSWSLTFSIGMALGGALASLGPAWALVLDGLTFAAAAAVLAGLPAMRVDEASRPALSVGAMAEAVQVIRSDRRLLRATLSKTPLAIGGGGALLTMHLVAADTAFMGTAGLTLGLLQLVKGVGTGIGPFLATSASKRQGERRVWSAAELASLAGMAAFAMASGPVGWVLASALWGMGVGANWVLASTELQLRSQDANVGRISAVDGMAMTSGFSLAVVGGAVLVWATGSAHAAAWSSLAVAMGAWLCLQWLTSEPAGAGLATQPAGAV